MRPTRPSHESSLDGNGASPRRTVPSSTVALSSSAQRNQIIPARFALATDQKVPPVHGPAPNATLLTCLTLHGWLHGCAAARVIRSRSVADLGDNFLYGFSRRRAKRGASRTPAGTMDAD